MYIIQNDKFYCQGKCIFMKTYNLLYNSESQFEEFLYSNSIEFSKEYLIRVHTCIHYAEDISDFVSMIRKFLPNSKIIGCSTSAVILNGKIMPGKCLISITELNNASVRTCLVPVKNAQSSGSELADTICDNISINNNSKFLLTFISSFYISTAVSDLVDCINQKFPDIQILGGIANHQDSPMPDSDNMISFVFNEKSVLNYGIASAVIDSNNLKVHSEVVYVTEPVGKTYTVTDVDNMIIKSVDGQNTIEWYQNILGVNLSNFEKNEDIQGLTSMFPIVKKNYGNIPWLISYSPQNEKLKIFSDEKEPVMYTTGNIKAGDKIKIAYSSMQHTIEVCQDVCNKLKEEPSDVLFAYSCISRTIMFKNCADWEFTPFKRTNLSGALMVSEIGNSEGANRFCNYTTVIASLAESNNKPRIDSSALALNVNMLYDNNQHIINYLINHSESDEENEVAIKQKQDIEKRLFTDPRTGLGNITKYFYDIGRGIRNKICIVNIKNRSLITAFMSEEDFEEHSVTCVKQIADFLGTNYYSCYFYNTKYLIIAAADEVIGDDFITKIKEVQALTMTQKYNTYVPVCEFAIVLNEDDMLSKAEMMLEKMSNSHECMQIYSKNSSIESERAEKIRMINLLNDAIINNRVVPYFQGIHDNELDCITTYEALMRIEDENGKAYSPFFFMPVAKEYGFYNEISCIMIDKVLKIFRDKTEKVTINLDVNDIYNYDIIHLILDFLNTAPHPENFIFEITESEEIKDYQIIDAFTDAIINAGGQIAIDDFGSGFSNLVYLFRINAQYIKIDGEIIKNICTDESACEIMEIITQWAKKHNKFVIAEFVENEQIQKIVSDYGIKYSQGYYYSKPEKRFL